MLDRSRKLKLTRYQTLLRDERRLSDHTRRLSARRDAPTTGQPAWPKARRGSHRRQVLDPWWHERGSWLGELESHPRFHRVRTPRDRGRTTTRRGFIGPERSTPPSREVDSMVVEIGPFACRTRGCGSHGSSRWVPPSRSLPPSRSIPRPHGSGPCPLGGASLRAERRLVWSEKRLAGRSDVVSRRVAVGRERRARPSPPARASARSVRGRARGTRAWGRAGAPAGSRSRCRRTSVPPDRTSGPG
jgi:hypothetical protein